MDCSIQLLLLHFTLRPYNYDFKLEMFAAKVSPTHARVLPLVSRDAAAPDLLSLASPQPVSSLSLSSRPS